MKTIEVTWPDLPKSAVTLIRSADGSLSVTISGPCTRLLNLLNRQSMEAALRELQFIARIWGASLVEPCPDAAVVSHQELSSSVGVPA